MGRLLNWTCHELQMKCTDIVWIQVEISLQCHLFLFHEHCFCDRSIQLFLVSGNTFYLMLLLRFKTSHFSCKIAFANVIAFVPFDEINVGLENASENYGEQKEPLISWNTAINESLNVDKFHKRFTGLYLAFVNGTPEKS